MDAFASFGILDWSKAAKASSITRSCWNCRAADCFDLRHRESASTAERAALHRRKLKRRWKRPGRRHKDPEVSLLNGVGAGRAIFERASRLLSSRSARPSAILGCKFGNLLVVWAGTLRSEPAVCRLRAHSAFSDVALSAAWSFSVTSILAIESR